MKNVHFLEENNLKAGAVNSKDLATATTGARIKMDQLERLIIVVAIAAGSAATVTPQFKQHNAASAGTSKALSHDNPYFHKIGAATVWTKVVPTAAADNLVLGALVSTGEALLAFEILPEDLDINGGFAWASVDFPVAGVARLATILLVAKDGSNKPAYDQAL